MRREFLWLLPLLMSVAVVNVPASEIQLYPVEKGRIIFDQMCEAGSHPTWDQILNLKQGEELLGLTADSLITVKVGELSCFVGECQGNYVSSSLIGGDDLLGAVKMKDAKYFHIIPVQVKPVDQAACQALYEKASNASLPEVQKERKCESVSVGSNLKFIVATRGFGQENGWISYVEEAQFRQPKKGPIIEVDRDTDPLRPVWAFIDQDRRMSILWRKASGICCPSEITLVLSSQDEQGSITFRLFYKAGGQPCD